MIELVDLTKKFGDLAAVDGLTLSVAPGEIFGFIGPNGAGKTTTIRMMAGVILPTSGSVRIDGVDMAAEPEEAKRRIGFIPDQPILYEKLTGMEFLRFIADLFEMKDDSFRKRVRETLKMFALEDRSGELIESYSHGMKQRLVIAAALLHDPRVIIVDEPMVGLDPAGIRMVKGLLRRLADAGTTIFMSTHTLEVAEDVCDRIGIIHRGALIATGTMEELKHASRAGANLEEVFLKLTEEEGFGP